MTQTPDCLPCEIKRLRRRVDALLNANNREVERRRALERAGRDLYFAGRWSCDRPADEAQLWEAMRDALQLPAGSATAVGLGVPTRKKLLILGFGRHGKDTVAEILRDEHGFKFISSSLFCAGRVMMPFFDRFSPYGSQVAGFDDRLFRSYTSVEECFEDRHNFRDVWHQQIAAWNQDDPTKLSREILEVADIYVGMRSVKEYEAAKHLYDDIWWVDATDRGLPPEDQSSMNLMFIPDEMRRIDNNGTLEDLRRAVTEALGELA
jgi:hypothetical protein